MFIIENICLGLNLITGITKKESKMLKLLGFVLYLMGCVGFTYILADCYAVIVSICFASVVIGDLLIRIAD